METTSYSTPPDRSLTYEPPLRFLVTEAFYVLCWVATPGVIVSLIIHAPWGYATAAITAIVAIWSMRRAFRIRLVVTDDEVTVTNYWKTYVIPWADVSAVAMMAIGKFAMIPVGSPQSGSTAGMDA